MRFLSLAVLLPVAAFAAVPVADLTGDARPADFVVRGATQKNFRLARGQALTLKLTGPAALAFDVRAEGVAPKAATPIVDLDGKMLLPHRWNVVPDWSARSDKGQALSMPSTVDVAVASGRHAVTLRWPADASGDALVAIRGVDVVAPLPDLARLSFDAPSLPLPTVVTARADLPIAPLAMSDSRSSGSKTRAVSAISARPAAEEPLYSRFSIDLRGGAQRSAESYTGPATQGQLGLELAWRVKPLLPILASVEGRLSRQAYQAKQTALDGRGLAHADVDEQRLDGFLGAGYDLGPWLLNSGRLVAMPVLGGQYTAIRNSGFPMDLAGPSAGLRTRFALSPAFAIQASARWTYNLLKKETLSVVGSPVSDLGVQAGVSLPLAGDYSFDVGYQGDILAMHFDTRVAHGVAVGVHSGF